MADYGSDSENEQFTYDKLGNRTSVNLRDGSNEAYSVDNTSNRYNSVGGESVGYDDTGNLTADQNGYGYEYDYENRLIKITKDAADIVEYTYDALGRRIEKVDVAADETTRYYYNDNWQVLSETDENGNTQRWYMYGNYIDEPLVMIDASDNEYYYARNHIYSTVALMDDKGDVLER